MDTLGAASSSDDDEEDVGGLEEGTCLRREERAEGLKLEGGQTVADGGVALRDLEEEEDEDLERRELSLWDLDDVTSRWKAGMATCSFQHSSASLSPSHA